jgi:hypothetical protein
VSWSRFVGAFLTLALVVGVMGVGRRVAPADALTPSKSPGYWLMSADGGVAAFGTANFGSMRGAPLARSVVASGATPTGLGYWMVAGDGGVFAFGDARFFGSTGGIRLNQPIVGMAPTPSGHGYWLVAGDGGVFAFGDARFFGSTGGIRLNQPIVGMAADPVGTGYWLVARDGGIFAFGDARFHGSTGDVALSQPIVGMAASADAGGYWLAAQDGGIFTFGDARFLGSSGSDPLPSAVVSIAATPHGYPFPPGATGYDISLYQCPGQPGGPIPPTSQAVAIVQVSGGAIYNSPNPCYLQEADWAGPDLSTYIFMDGLPSPAPAESQTGPAGTCDGNVNCESYNFGWYWARHWVNYSRTLGVNPSLWWLDVETDGMWNGDQASNARVISGAVAGIQSVGAVPGVYSTAYQWGKIAGSLTLPDIPLWVPGAGNISSGTFSAENFCSTPMELYEPFAGGKVTLVQYGYAGNGYSGPPSNYDLDFACP